MRQDALRSLQVPPALAASLAAQLQISGSRLSPMQALHAAIDTWTALERQAREAATHAASLPARGYQWKTVFLPEGTQLRMFCCHMARYAMVEREHLVFEGRNVSPRGMTLIIAGTGRNAWRDLWLKFPEDRFWQQALVCRQRQQHQLQLQLQPPPDTAIHEAMAAAADAMTAALHTALALAERLGASSAPPPASVERRVQQLRRSSDLLGEDCAFD